MSQALRAEFDLPSPESTTDVRLVVVDMDGTLLAEDGSVPEGLWSLLDRMQERGIAFAPASGRQYATLEKDFERSAQDMVFIAENGTYVMRGGVELAAHTLDGSVVARVVDKVRERAASGVDLGVIVCGKDSAYVERTDSAFLNEARKYYAKLTETEDVLGHEDEILKVAIFDLGDAAGSIEMLKSSFPLLKIVVSGKHTIDVMDAAINKGVAVQDLQAALGITPAQTVAFGDYLNDLEMLDAAELSFAMSNAHPEVKQRANYSAPSNADNGVLRVLEAILDLRD